MHAPLLLLSHLRGQNPIFRCTVAYLPYIPGGPGELVEGWRGFPRDMDLMRGYSLSQTFLSYYELEYSNSNHYSLQQYHWSFFIMCTARIGLPSGEEYG